MRHLLLLLLAVGSLAGQKPAYLSTDEFAEDWKVSKQFTIAVATKMPAEFYDFKATPEEMTFGEQVVHIAASLYFRFQSISGEKAPVTAMPKNPTKEVALEWLTGSFDYVLRVLPKITDEKLAAIKFPVKFEGRTGDVRGKEMARNMFMHVAHHRAQCEVYLRLKGIAPPPYTF